ncbi:MAG: PCMD domain-containing protein, partial [Muribaculaceae bacterium]|nr:PCMD domain-containing protein [Muribaculaceae bacterium]
ANVMPTDDTSTGKGQAAMLKTEFKGIAGIGKLAAGSIFAGSYVRTDGTNGVLSFGRPFTQRPTKLRGALKYHTEPISDATSGFESMVGRPDTCIVWIALIDSEEPFEIRTNPSNRHLFNPDGDEVVAYGFVEYGRNVEEYTEFEIELKYKSTSRIPSYILCVSSSSKYGDYFTGGRGSVLYIDDLSLLYDY